MNWPFIFRCFTFGLIWGVWQVASGIYILDAMPDAFQWLKLTSAGVVAFCGAVFTYTRDPEHAWEMKR